MYWFKVPKRRGRGRHRKKRHNFWLSFREWLWPSMGVMPMLRWFELRIKRNDNAIHRTSMGVALGVGVSFTPFFGFHTLIVLVLSWLLKGNFWIGALATFVGNPWTFPFITFWTFRMGHFILGNSSEKEALTQAPPLSELWAQLPYFWEHYIWPMTVGGVPSGIVAGAVTYFFIHGSIRRYQKGRLERIRAARERHKKAKASPKPGRFASFSGSILANRLKKRSKKQAEKQKADKKGAGK